MRFIVLAACLVVLSTAPAVGAIEGEFDPAFGNDAGRSVYFADFGNSNAASAGGIERLASGGYLAVSAVDTPSGPRVLYARFDHAGKPNLPQSLVADDLAPDGRVLIDAGGHVAYTSAVLQSGRAAIRVVRRLANATPEPGFGNAGIAVIAHPTLDLVATGLMQDSTGRIVVVGYAKPAGTPADDNLVDAMLARLGGDGMPDATFGNAGIVVHDVPSPVQEHAREQLFDLVELPDHRLGACGLQDQHTGLESGYDLLMLQLDANGAYDNTFAGAGYARWDFTGIVSVGEVCRRLLYQPISGRYIAVASSSTDDDPEQVRLVAITLAGLLDTSFNPIGSMPGVFDVPFGNGSKNTFGDAAVDALRRVVVLAQTSLDPGQTQYRTQVARVTAAGNRDTTFGSPNGIAPVPMRFLASPDTERFAVPRSGVLRFDKSRPLALFGVRDSGSDTELALARLTTDAIFENDFEQ